VNRRLRILLALLAALALTAAACGSDKKSDTGSGSASTATVKPKVTIGAQDFGESAILAEIYKQGLAVKGFDASLQKLGGFRDLEMKAFDGGTINFAPEYAASTLEFLNTKKGEATSDAAATVAKLQTYLDAKKLKALKVTDAVDTNAFVVTQTTATRLSLKSLSDLATKGKDLTLGGPADCQTNPFCIPGLKSKYSLDLTAKFKALETGQVVAALDAGQIDVALLFSTDGRIKAKNYVLLDDDKKMLAADNVVPIVSTALAASSELVTATDAISAKLTTTKLIDMNKKYDVDKADAAVIAKDFLAAEGLDKK
jgi:osmoprotectant transport system substrate-binding protein